MKKILQRMVIFLMAILLFACISKEKASDIDKGYHMLLQNDLKTDLFLNTTPLTGLRSAATGTSECSACASK